MWQNPQFTADLVTFIEEILNGKLYFFVQCYCMYAAQKIKFSIKDFFGKYDQIRSLVLRL